MERGTPPPENPDAGRPPGGEPLPAPEAPAGPQAPLAPGPQPPPGYGGPVPPGGWQQPIAQQRSGWEGRPLASWGSRVAAQVIDWVVLLIPGAILFVLIVGGAIGLTGSDNDDTTWWAVVGSSILFALVWAVISLLYAPLLMRREGKRNGQTWGKQLIGITVVRDSGESAGFWWSALREVVVKNLLVGIASTILPLIPWLLDNLWPLWDDENRALHDMVVQSHVVRV